MVAPIESISRYGCSTINTQFPISHKRMQELIKKINDEEKNRRKLSKKEIEASWEQFRPKKTTKDNTESDVL